MSATGDRSRADRPDDLTGPDLPRAAAEIDAGGHLSRRVICLADQPVVDGALIEAAQRGDQATSTRKPGLEVIAEGTGLLPQGVPAGELIVRSRLANRRSQARS